MSEFMRLDPNAPATLQAVVGAVTRPLSTLNEPQILKLVSEGRLSDLFPFQPRAGQSVPPDFVSEENLVQAALASGAPANPNGGAGAIWQVN